MHSIILIQSCKNLSPWSLPSIPSVLQVQATKLFSDDSILREIQVLAKVSSKRKEIFKKKKIFNETMSSVINDGKGFQSKRKIRVCEIHVNGSPCVELTQDWVLHKCIFLSIYFSLLLVYVKISPKMNENFLVRLIFRAILTIDFCQRTVMVTQLYHAEASPVRAQSISRAHWQLESIWAQTGSQSVLRQVTLRL